MLIIFYTKIFFVGAQIYSKIFNWNFEFWSLGSRVCRFWGLLGWKRALNYQKGDNPRFGVVLALEWGFLNFLGFPNFSKIGLVFSQDHALGNYFLKKILVHEYEKLKFFYQGYIDQSFHYTSITLLRNIFRLAQNLCSKISHFGNYRGGGP